jgi:hypothetical protein
MVNVATSRGHCTAAEDHVLSSCVLLNTDESVDARLSAITEEWERACREGRRLGMADEAVSRQKRYKAWKQTLNRVAAAFGAVNDLLAGD